METWAYDAFGRSGTTGTSGYPWRYTGQRLDPWTGTYHDKAREYSPQLGRFLQADPARFVDGPNVYAYVGNSPWNATDPTGLCVTRVGPDGSTTNVGICGTSQESADFVAARLADPNSEFSTVEAAAVATDRLVQVVFSGTDMDGNDVNGGRAAEVTPARGPYAGQTVSMVYLDPGDIPEVNGVHADTGARMRRTELSLEEVAEHEVVGHVGDHISGIPRNETNAISAENRYRERIGNPFRRNDDTGRISRRRRPWP